VAPVTQSHGAGRDERRRTAGIGTTEEATEETIEEAIEEAIEKTIRERSGSAGRARRARAYSRMMNGVLPIGVLKRYV
jgi:hypothetical protein